MIWIIGIVGFFIVLFLVKFATATSQDANYVKSNGGMKVLYSTLIESVKENRHSARVREGSMNSLVIDGEFTDIVGGVYRGEWALSIQHTFKILQVTYKANVRLNNVAPINKRWDFPINLDQKRMAEIITKEMDKTMAYGIYQ